MSKGKVTLHVPNDIRYLPLVLESAAVTARIAGFEEAALGKVCLGLEEAVVNIIEHAYLPSEEAAFDVSLEPSPLGLKIVLSEQGLPFDPDAVERYNPADPNQVLSGAGLGLHLMKQCFDEVRFHNRGKLGKETELTKYLAEPLAALPADAAPAASPILEKAMPTPFIVRKLDASEAIEVARCAYFAYGYGYAQEYIYYPDLIKEYNKSGKVVSLLAVAEDGNIMGHAALKIEDSDPGIAELSAAFVKPEYRGQGCLGKITQALLQEGYERGLTAVFARAVTTHPYSQKEVHKYGLTDCLILLARRLPVDFKGIGSGGQRESHVYAFRYLVSLPTSTLYPPPQHQDMIARIYQNLKVEVVLAPAAASLPSVPASLQVQTDIASTATIQVDAYGCNVVDEVRRALRNLCYEHMEVIYLSLPLDDPLTAVVTHDFELAGFFFGGVIPGTADKHRLVLQYLNNYRINYDFVQLNSAFGKELLAYIKDHDPANSV